MVRNPHITKGTLVKRMDKTIEFREIEIPCAPDASEETFGFVFESKNPPRNNLSSGRDWDRRSLAFRGDLTLKRVHSVIYSHLVGKLDLTLQEMEDNTWLPDFVAEYLSRNRTSGLILANMSHTAPEERKKVMSNISLKKGSAKKFQVFVARSLIDVGDMKHDEAMWEIYVPLIDFLLRTFVALIRNEITVDTSEGKS